MTLTVAAIIVVALTFDFVNGFSGDFKAMDVLKWKEIIEDLERATDGLERVANIIEATVLKHT